MAKILYEKIHDFDADLDNDLSDDTFECDEANIEEDAVDKVFEKNKILKFFSTSKKFYIAISVLCSFLIAAQLYLQHNMYSPEEREFLNDNIYSGNNLNISGDELQGVVSSLEDELGISIADGCEDEYCILNSVLENPNLSDTEKDVFYRVVQIINENPYVNREEVYSSLLNVDVLYKNRPFSFNKDVEGVYSHEYESIGIFVDDPEYRVLIHEIIHCIFTNDNTINLPAYFSEGVTELLANEYFSETPFVELTNYPFEIAVVKMLCEVSSPEAVLEAYSTGDMSVVAKKIAEVSGDEESAMDALNMLDYTMKRFNGELGEGEETITDKDEIINSFIPLFRDVVEAKYSDIDHSLVSYYYNEILFANIFDEDPYNNYVDDLMEFGSDHKAYFSENLRNTLKNDGSIQKVNSIVNKSSTSSY